MHLLGNYPNVNIEGIGEEVVEEVKSFGTVKETGVGEEIKEDDIEEGMLVGSDTDKVEDWTGIEDIEEIKKDDIEEGMLVGSDTDKVEDWTGFEDIEEIKKDKIEEGMLVGGDTDKVEDWTGFEDIEEWFPGPDVSSSSCIWYVVEFKGHPWLGPLIFRIVAMQADRRSILDGLSSPDGKDNAQLNFVSLTALRAATLILRA